MEDVFWRPFFCAGCLFTGCEAAFARAERSRTPPDLPEKAASHPVTRQSAQTIGVRKRLPFSLSKAWCDSTVVVTLAHRNLSYSSVVWSYGTNWKHVGIHPGFKTHGHERFILSNKYTNNIACYKNLDESQDNVTRDKNFLWKKSCTNL